MSVLLKPREFGGLSWTDIMLLDDRAGSGWSEGCVSVWLKSEKSTWSVLLFPWEAPAATSLSSMPRPSPTMTTRRPDCLINSFLAIQWVSVRYVVVVVGCVWW